MAKFLTTRDTTSEIEKIINNAKNKLVLISAFVKVPESLFQNLKVADSRKVKITLVYGKHELDHDVKNQLEQLDNLSLHFLQNLHAKCFFNEECMVITSLNLLDFSEQNNREMGVLISIEQDRDVFNEALQEANRIIALSTPIDLVEAKNKNYSSKTTQNGYCIRCGIPITYNLERPYCRKCFLRWSKWGKPEDYRMYYCHTCGEPAPTSKAKPLCSSCYSKSRR